MWTVDPAQRRLHLQQTFADDIAFYLKGTKSNMDRMQSVLGFFCFVSEAKIN
jgi:hypothetical protein